MGQDDYRICPYCAEEVKKEAVKCKHCKSVLESAVSVVKEECEEDAGQENDSVMVEHRYPKCNIFIQEGATFAGTLRRSWPGKMANPGL